MSNPRFDPAYQRGYVEPEPAASTPRIMDATTHRNPWLALLWALAALLTVGGIAARLVVGAVELAPPSDPFTFYVLTELLDGVFPWLVAAGLLALVGAVFVHALEWRRRARVAVEDAAAPGDARGGDDE